MRITDRTVWGLPVSGSEFVLFILIGGVMLLAILAALRPFLRTIMNIGGWA